MNQSQLDKLLLEAVSDHDVNAASQLLRQGANVHVREKYGHTPLHIAASGGNVGMIKLLLNHGADVNAKLDNGSTPLHAIYHGMNPIYAIPGWDFTEARDLVIAKGANVDSEDKWGRKPGDMADPQKTVELARPSSNKANPPQSQGLFERLINSFNNIIIRLFHSKEPGLVDLLEASSIDAPSVGKRPETNLAQPELVSALNAYNQIKDEPLNHSINTLTAYSTGKNGRSGRYR